MNSTPLLLNVHGYGAVSSAGHNPAALYAACQGKGNVESGSLSYMVGEQTLTYSTKPVNMAGVKKLVPKHPRLRRSSPITKFAMVAAMQALGETRVAQVRAGEFRLGIVVSLFNGCIGYSNRFYKEVLDDPKFASPILFPETVFNAPASHVASFLGSDGPVYSLIGDTATWFSAMRVAQDWLEMDQVDGCLVIAAEELDWLSSKALRLYSKTLEASEGAAAVYVEAASSTGKNQQITDKTTGKTTNKEGIVMDWLSEPFDYTSSEERQLAVKSAFGSFPEMTAGDKAGDKANDGAESILLVDSLSGDMRFDREEREILQGWDGGRMSPASALGYGMGVSAGFQTIAALESLKTDYRVARVLATGSNQHAFAAQFSHSI